MSDDEAIILDHAALIELLADIDAWLGNSEGLMIEDVIEWRDELAGAIGEKRLETREVAKQARRRPA